MKCIRLKLYRYCCYLFVVTALLGCAKWRGAIGIDADYQREIHHAVGDLLMRLEQPLDDNLPVLVASIVDIDSLEETSTFGRSLAELVASEFVKRYYAVREIKLRTSIYLKQEKGEFLLSRDIHDLSLQVNAQAIVVGTYATGKDTLQLNIRLVDAESSIVLSSYDTVLPIGSETRAMLLN